MRPDGNRGQAYTLEGVIGGLVILSALLIAGQSVLLSPAAGGTVDVAERDNLKQQASDVLSVGAQNETFSLEVLARYWSQSKRTFYGGQTPRLGYGSDPPEGALFTLLEENFADRARNYNLNMRYMPKDPADDPGTLRVVYRGEPGEDAVVASQTITLYDNQTLTCPVCDPIELWQYDTDPRDNDDGYYPIPNAVEGPIYNVVEVRLVVW